MASHASPGVDGLNKEPRVMRCRGDWWYTRPFAYKTSRRASRILCGIIGPLQTFATPGQAGLPAEFKHINKRRKRNLQGFP